MAADTLGSYGSMARCYIWPQDSFSNYTLLGDFSNRPQDCCQNYNIWFSSCSRFPDLNRIMKVFKNTKSILWTSLSSHSLLPCSPAHLCHPSTPPSPALLALLLSCYCFFHAHLLFLLFLRSPACPPSSCPSHCHPCLSFLHFCPPSFPHLILPLFFRWTTPQCLALAATMQTSSSSVMWVTPCLWHCLHYSLLN